MQYNTYIVTYSGGLVSDSCGCIAYDTKTDARDKVLQLCTSPGGAFIYTNTQRNGKSSDPRSYKIHKINGMTATMTQINTLDGLDEVAFQKHLLAAGVS